MTRSPIQLDITEDSDIEAAMDRISDEESRLDFFMNDAGVVLPNVSLRKACTNDIETTLSVNLRGPILLTKCALPLLLNDVGSGRQRLEW